MEFTIYTFGDVEVFRAALAGVAAVFGSSLFSSADGLGFGSLITLSLMIGLVVMLFGGIVQQKVDIGMFFMVIVVFFIMFVPKFSVNIEDHSGSQVAKVDDVPLGIAFPAGLVSGISHDLNEKMGTAFTTVQSNSGALNSPGALTSPLKLLFSLRNASKLTLDKDPRLVTNLANLVAYCLAGRQTNYSDWRNATMAGKSATANSPGLGPVMEMLSRGSSSPGLTMYQPTTPGADFALTPCDTATTTIQAELENALSAASATIPGASLSQTSINLGKLLTAAAAKDGAATITFAGGKASVTDVLLSDQTEILQNLFGASSAAAESFVTTAIFGTYIDNAFLCANNSGNPTDWAQCMPMMQAVNQGAEDEAGSGALFQRVIFHSMNAMFFIWICLAPVVAVVMLIKGVRGLPLAGSYVLFGAWTVSWYVGASIVNFYMLKQLQYELQMLGGIDQLTQASFWSFFDIMQTKISIAGSMLASVPLIMMTIMSGSMYGMVSMANRFSGQDRYDEKLNTPDLSQSAPIHMREAKLTTQYGAPTVDKRFAEGPDFSFTNSMKIGQQESAGSTHSRARKLASGLSDAFSELRGDKELGAKLTSWGTAHGISNLDSFVGNLTKGTTAEKTSQGSNEVTEGTRNTMALKGEVGGEMSASFFKDSAKNMLDRTIKEVNGGATGSPPGKGKRTMANAYIGGSASDTQSKDVTGGRKQTVTGSGAESKAAGIAENLTTQETGGLNFAKLQSLARQFTHDFGYALTETTQNELADTTQYTESANNVSSLEKAYTSTNKVAPHQMLNKIYATGADRTLDDLDLRMRTDNEIGASGQPRSKMYQGSFNDHFTAYNGYFNGGDAKRLATLKALEDVGMVDQNATVARNGLVGVMAKVAGTENVVYRPVTTVTADGYKVNGMPEKLQRAENLKGPAQHTFREPGAAMKGAPKTDLEADKVIKELGKHNKGFIAKKVQSDQSVVKKEGQKHRAEASEIRPGQGDFKNPHDES